MSGDLARERARLSFWCMAAAVLLATGGAVVAAAAIHSAHLGDDVRRHGVLVLSLTCGLFLVAATLRLAVWLLTGRHEDGARAAATAVVGAALVPVHLWTHSFVDVDAIPVDTLAVLGATRMVATVLVLVLLMLAVARPHPHDRAYLLAAAAWTSALGLLATGAAATWWPQEVDAALRGVSLATALLWGAAAGYTAHRTDTRPWARGMAPLLLLMGMTEVLVALDPRAPGVGATAAVLLTALLSLAAVARGLHDLRGVVAAERRRTGDLERDLLAMRDDLALLQQRERRLAHDARGTLAGVRAAMQIWAAGPSSDGPPAVAGPAPEEQLRRAAMTEIARLEAALSERRVELGRGPVALDRVVERAAHARRGEIVVDVPGLVVLGQAADLELALREVLDRCLVDPSRRVVVEGWRRHDGVAVVDVAVKGCGGPVGPVPAASLTHADHLMRRQGGELEVGAGGGVRLAIPLCPAPPPAHQVPRQRGPQLERV